MYRYVYTYIYIYIYNIYIYVCIYIYTKQNNKSTETKTHEESNSTLENFKTMQHPKNVHYKRPPRPTGKRRITECYNIHRRNYENFGNLRKTIEKSIRHQSDPNGNTINLTKHSFTKA